MKMYIRIYYIYIYINVKKNQLIIINLPFINNNILIIS